MSAKNTPFPLPGTDTPTDAPTDVPAQGVAGDAGAHTHALRISSYKVLGVIGEGSMGVVYHAEQENPHREVALKVLKAGRASAAARKRFEHEAQTLGRLQHPGIAQIFEAGLADVGFGAQPFFAMELVRGVSLSEYARSHSLGTRERLSLMARICDGVQHAHQKGVVHRDLKPGNILVDEAGEPKIVDFGIALVADVDHGKSAAGDHGQRELAGTIPYMSYEQLQGDPAEQDTRVDVYALGVIAYQLLAERLPFDLVGKAMPQALRIVGESEPPRLGAWNRSLRGDVELIVGKALERDKARRYQSASELAADIRRFFSDEPILARPPSALYQARKFAKRNKAVVGGIAATFVMLVVAVVGTGMGLGRARQAESDATAIKDFLIDSIMAAADPEKMGSSATVAEAMDAGAGRLEVGEFAGRPRVEAAIRTTLGATYRNLGLLNTSEKHLAAALGTYRASLGNEDPNTLACMNELAMTLKKRGRIGDAEPLFREALATQRRVLGEEHTATLETLHNVAALLATLGRLEEAESMFMDATEKQGRVLGQEHRNTLKSMQYRALVLKSQGKTGEAERIYRKVLATQRRVLGDQHPDTLVTSSNLATLLQELGRLDDAAALYRDTLQGQRSALGDDHPLTLETTNNLAALMQRQGRLGEAESLYRKTVQRLERKLGVKNPATITSMFGLACLLDDTGKSYEAETLYRETLSRRREMLPPAHPEIADALVRLGMLHLVRGENTAAEPLLRECVDIRRKAYPAGDWRAANAESALGECLMGLMEFSEAERLLLRAYPVIKSQLGGSDPRVQKALQRIVDLYIAWGEPVKAARYRNELSSSTP